MNLVDLRISALVDPGSWRCPGRGSVKRLRYVEFKESRALEVELVRLLRMCNYNRC